MPASRRLIARTPMKPIVLLVCGGAACAAAIAVGVAFVPDDPAYAAGLVAGGIAFHSAMIVLDLRSTSAFGVAGVVSGERSLPYRYLAGRIGLVAGGACMWALDYALAWLVLPLLFMGDVLSDLRYVGMFLLALGAIHMVGWLSNRSLAHKSAASDDGLHSPT